ncbi:MFS transporter [Beijerinckiaceae bacterium RH AL1]|nr:OFA family MFS transporter [Beijerinckiaceae bacterium]VVB49646.1 MFS transporter [Beijerinckiaceae bacterium RH CH11]VVB49724.1 MFS transporter [Beijerinckiaceae bacterium RH AL8]VVC57007.1 MFS transporter [Beijerinckiaceae bacterium RH AL1]
MTVLDQAAGHGGAEPGFFTRERTVAKPGFNRWLVPPAALLIHLSIGMAYALSVFWKPLAKVIPNEDAACKTIGFFQLLTSTSCNWPDTVTVKAFETGIVFLGISAALFGGWLEKAGPRKAALVAAVCWGGGFVISALAVQVHQLWLLYLGMGLVGGVGLGLGYISPVSTLIKWFPDRRGMATGMAIMGFGGGAMIGAPLANLLMSGGEIVPGLKVAGFKSATGAPGVMETFLTLGIVYFVVMCIGALMYRVPPENWAPDGFSPLARSNRLISAGDVHLDDAHKTFSFWMIWAVLFLNVTAGIAVLSIASPMLQTIFGPTLIGLAAGVKPNPDQLKAIAAVAAGFVGLLSLFNIGGRFFWASMSDKIGRKATYFTFFVLGILLYASVPTLADHGQKALFVGALCIILSMYGGGFATVPAYLADIFGTKFVGAIHGRLLTAWSAAGVVGSEIIVGVRDHEIAAGVPKTEVYDAVMYVMVGLLALGFICNLLIRPVDPKWHMDASAPVDGSTVAAGRTSGQGIGKGSLSGATLVPWLIIAIPVAWGLYKALLSAAKILS